MQQVASPGLEGRGVEHVQTAEEEVVGVDQVVVDLRVLACRTGKVRSVQWSQDRTGLSHTHEG